MKNYWEEIRTVIDDMSLRERVMIFIAAAVMVIALMDVVLLDPLLARQKILSAQVVQQQEKMKGLQARMQDLLQARSDDEHSPLRDRLAQLKQQLQEQDGYLQSRRDRLVEPDKMAGLLRQVLGKNDRLQLVEFKTLPVSLLIEKPQTADSAAQSDASNSTGELQPDVRNQLYKHGVQITVRGDYRDLLRYVTALEKLPAQMFWGDANLSVEKYPDAAFTLTVYTLSLDKTWMAI